jgi:predicted esterase
MKSKSLVWILLIISTGLYAQNRYQSEIFRNCSVTASDCVYKTVEHTVLYINRKQDLKMDIYSPVGDTLSKRPLLIWLHSGGYVMGNFKDREIVRLCEDFAKRGFVTASVEYRLYTFGNALNLWKLIYKAAQDVNDATDYLINNANIYGISPNYVYLGGFSAGAITALHCGFLHQENQTDFSNQNLPNIYGSVSPFTDIPYKGIISIAGGVPHNEIITNRYPVAVLSFHGDRDALVNTLYGTPVYEIENTDVVSIYNHVTSFLGGIASEISEDFFLNIALKDAIIPPLYGSLSTHKKFDQLKIKNMLHLFEGQGHSLFKNMDVNSFIYDTIKNKVTEFLYQLLKPDTDKRLSVSNYSPAVSRNSTVTYEAPQGFSKYLWKIENGSVLEENENKIRICWNKKGEGIIKLLVANEVGCYSDTAVFKVNIERKTQRTGTGNGFRFVLIAALVLLVIIYVVYRKNKNR